MKRLSVDQYEWSSWKNGQGSSSQIAIFPKGARFPHDDFDWRVSSASIMGDTEFSQFPGYQRLLMVMSGEGLWLNGQKFELFARHSFEGSELTHARLEQGEVHDLNVIFRPDKVLADMRKFELSGHESGQIQLKKGIHFLFCARGNVISAGISIQEGETLEITPGAENISLSSREHSTLILISLLQPTST